MPTKYENTARLKREDPETPKFYLTDITLGH